MKLSIHLATTTGRTEFVIIKFRNCRCVLPHAAGVLRSHGLASLAAKRFLEFRHVAHYAVDAPMSGGVRVHADQHARKFRSDVLAPHAAKTQEEALVRS